MGKLIKLGLLSVALLATIVVKASEKLSVKIGSKTSKIVSISLTNTTAGEVVYIKDFDGVILFSENLQKSPGYRKVFSFLTLPEGLYFVESKSEDKILSTPLVVGEETVNLVDNSAKVYTAPEITIEGDHAKVLVKNVNKVPVSITIFDQSGTSLSVEEDNTNELVYGHYDASHLDEKIIIVSVSEGEYSFVKEIKF